jgi:hypothetical protein
MSAADEALRVARAAGVGVTSDGYRLSVAAPVQPPAAVLELLRQQHVPAPCSEGRVGNIRPEWMRE